MSQLLLNILETERRYLARELHDGVAQTTLQLGLQAGICRKLLERGNLDMLATELAQLEERAQLASRQVREVIADLRPPQVGPETGIKEHLAQVVETHLSRGGPPVAYRCEWTDQTPTLSVEQQLALVRVVQEALLNIRKHAQARHVHLILSTDEDSHILTISDDGKGFNPAELPAQPADKGGSGLANLQNRVLVIGGQVKLTSGPEGAGTKITVLLPKK